MSVESESEIELEIRMELEQLEKQFNADGRTEMYKSRSSSPPEARYSAFEFAEAESEKEELEDKLRLLLGKTEEFSQQINKMNACNADLLNRNKELVAENERLSEGGGDSQHNSGNVSVCPSPRAMELLLSETRAKLAKLEMAHSETLRGQHDLQRELDREKWARVHAEKERDAYSAAYEASLQHFEKWSGRD
ncbi:hypothetical protein B484DRAFT_456115 [Ochromonadaceae sp. CCMP2298]|nr:hypothetical protein B484DRAFT_456115 [Ochromonadaceae sp. CCMP2298]|mmetsp:Transcript_11614/g.25872  ORF Transcript_11614/g.25872 Transcript_11614/m.25872 type:complete len:193 (+) Transcript_11614:83-661(+)